MGGTQDDIYDEGHTNMLTALPQNHQFSYYDGELNMEASVDINNDFIGKNKAHLSFFRQHEEEKRVAFSKLRD